MLGRPLIAPTTFGDRQYEGEFPLPKMKTKLRNDDEIAATLFRLHGADSWAWHHMSKRLKKKYKIEEM